MKGDNSARNLVDNGMSATAITNMTVRKAGVVELRSLAHRENAQREEAHELHQDLGRQERAKFLACSGN